MSMRISSILRVAALVPVIAAGLVVSPVAVAQEQPQAIEEILVTVQRREQSIMDVPVAVSAITGAEIQAAGIKDVFDLQQNVVGLIIGQSQTSTSTNFSIRGIGSTSNNFGVESSVVLYVDGVYRSRQSSLINDLADLEMVEVARGPQGTLFGKNTASGAIIMRTVRPSQDRDAYVEVTAGDRGLIRFGAASNFSLGDNAAMRATLFGSQRDGYVDDAERGKDFYNDRDRWGARLQFAFNEPGDDFNARIIADYSEIDETCCVAVARVDGLVSQSSLATGIPAFGSDSAVAALGGTIFTDFPYPPGLFPPQLDVRQGVGFDDYVVAYDSVPNSTNEDAGLSAEFNWAIGDSATFTSIALGGSSELTWGSSNATSCVATSLQDDSWNGPRAVTGGTVTVAPIETATYQLICTGAGGATTRANASRSLAHKATIGRTLCRRPIASATLCWISVGCCDEACTTMSPPSCGRASAACPSR